MRSSNGITYENRLLINGELVPSSDGKTFSVTNPATLEKTADVYEASVEDANAAVAAAKAAFPLWSALSPQERAKPFKKFAELLRQHHEELAHLEAISMGRPVTQYWDAFAAAGHYDHYAEAWHTNLGTTSLNTPGFVNMTLRQPYGVVAAIIPWNVPLLFFAAKSAPALMAGNTVVLKSSEKAPLTSAKAAALILEAGFPKGVFNVLHGHGAGAGSTLAHHMDVRVLSFTGSSRTGRLIQEAAAKSNLKNIVLELGGKSPALIFADADLEKAAHDTQYSIQWNSGQVCMANSRIYVHESVADRFVTAFRSKFRSVVAGDPTSKTTTHGPQADKVQYDNVLRFLDEGKKSAARLELGGRGLKDELGGFFVEPTIFTGAPETADIMKQEIFGPVVAINTFATEDEAVAKANNSEFGLYAAVFTKDVDRAMRVARRLEAGTVAINCTSPTGAHDMPFGGWKGSGVGREGWGSSMDNFLETKTVLMKIADQ